MKGLLIKDGRLMITQGKTLLGIAAFMIICSFLQGDSFPQFAASYSIMMTTIFTISTVSYDEYDNGIKYLLVLPVERRTYVKEKYCFGILMSCMVWGICSLIGIAGAFFQNAGWVGRISDFQPVCSHAGSSASWYLPSGYLLLWSRKRKRHLYRNAGLHLLCSDCIFQIEMECSIDGK